MNKFVRFSSGTVKGITAGFVGQTACSVGRVLGHDALSKFDQVIGITWDVDSSHNEPYLSTSFSFFGTSRKPCSLPQGTTSWTILRIQKKPSTPFL
jgi:hypothetical protein